MKLDAKLIVEKVCATIKSSFNYLMVNKISNFTLWDLDLSNIVQLNILANKQKQEKGLLQTNLFHPL